MSRPARKRSCEALAALLMTGLAVLSAAAGPFSQLVVFGDSLSDIGNIAQATFGVYPNDYYYEDRFSNGPVYAEFLAAGLRLPALVHSRGGGTNYAHGSALTSGTGFPQNLVVRDVDDQVRQYLSAGRADADALFLFLAGGNDLVAGMNVEVSVANLAGDIERLISAGASQFLVLNLPLLGYTPRFNDNPTSFADYNVRSRQFNAALATMLGDVQSSHPAITMFTFDLADLFVQMLRNPAAFGFTNVTDPAAPGLEAGPVSYDTNRVVSNPDEYVFWDDFHPTAAAHALLGHRLLDLFAEPGDFNRDGIVDVADYVVWRAEVGTRFDEQDYLVWQTNFGRSAASRLNHGTSATVPEPATAGFLCIGLIITWSRRPSRFTTP